MDLGNQSSAREGRGEISGQNTFAHRMQSWTPKTHDDDIFDPPTTAEAFARLEAAMDKAKSYHSAYTCTTTGDMLDPPTTAERFARIEAAIDEDATRGRIRFATLEHPRLIATKPHGSPQRHGIIASREKHRLKHRPSQLSDYFLRAGSSCPDTLKVVSSDQSRNNAAPAPSNNLESQRPTAAEKGEQTSNWTRSEVDAGTGKVSTLRPEYVDFSYNNSVGSQRDSDIFRSSTAMRNFMDDAFDRARKKYA